MDGTIHGRVRAAVVLADPCKRSVRPDDVILGTLQLHHHASSLVVAQAGAETEVIDHGGRCVHNQQKGEQKGRLPHL